MKRGVIAAACVAALALAAGFALAKDRADENGVNTTKEFTVLGKTVTVDITSPGRIVISIDGEWRYRGTPGIPPRFYGLPENARRAWEKLEGRTVAVEWGPVIDLGDHSVLVFETWHMAKRGLIGRVWLESVWPTKEEGYVDGMLLDHDGTYAECIESLDDGVDPLQAETAVETVEKTGDTAFRYRCRANGEDPARTRVYQRALRYTVGEPPAADAK